MPAKASPGLDPGPGCVLKRGQFQKASEFCVLRNDEQSIESTPRASVNRTTAFALKYTPPFDR